MLFVVTNHKNTGFIFEWIRFSSNFVLEDNFKSPRNLESRLLDCNARMTDLNVVQID